MINIIRQGRGFNRGQRFECVCQSCGCIFEFDFPADTKVIPVLADEVQTVVPCPCCGRHLAAT